MSYMKDPNMQAAMDKIIAVLKEHDLMGVCIISGQNEKESRSGFFQFVEPSWSCMATETQPDGSIGIRLRSQLKDYPNREAQQKKLESTVNGLSGILEASRPILYTLANLLREIGSRFEIVSCTTDKTVTSGKVINE